MVLRTLARAALLLVWWGPVVSAQTEAPASAAPLNAAALKPKIEQYLEAQSRVFLFGGAVLVARDGEVLFSRGYGPANAEWDVPNTPETRFRLGSITKQFTATAILRLQQQKKLSVQDPICAHLSPCPDAWKPITIHHLLTHTSGIPSYTSSPEYRKTMMVPKTVDDMVAGFRDKPLEFAPGEQFRYNNSGYFLLGVIIEKVAGRKYEQVLRDEIFAPLGMSDTGYDWSEPLLPRRASGYARRDEGLVNAPFLDMQQPYSAGSLYSTAGDLLKWDRALYTDHVLPKPALETMFTPFKNDYAYGWSITPEGKGPSGKLQVGHGGGINGFSTMYTRVPEDKVAVIVLSNVENANSGAIARDILSMLYGKPYQVPAERSTVAVKPDILASYVGRYQIAPEFVLTVTLEDGKLMTQATGQGKLQVYPESETTFFLKVVDAQLTFARDEQGKVSHVTLHQNGRDTKAVRIE
jgi:CubicO group peptidase (beta-lactamase class C family)